MAWGVVRLPEWQVVLSERICLAGVRIAKTLIRARYYALTQATIGMWSVLSEVHVNTNRTADCALGHTPVW